MMDLPRPTLLPTRAMAAIRKKAWIRQRVAWEGRKH
jgi:hypothetical protein